MRRRDFLKTPFILPGTLPIYNKIQGALNFLEEQKDQEILNAKERILEIANDDSYFSKIHPSNLYTKELKDKRIDYIRATIEKVAQHPDNSGKISHVIYSQKDYFKKVITSNPAFSIPLGTRILKDFNKDGEGVTLLSTMNVEEEEHGEWYGNGIIQREAHKERFSIPYATDKEILLLGQGSLLGALGSAITLVTFGQEDERSTEIKLYCFAKTPFRGMGSGTAVRRTLEGFKQLMNLPDRLRNYFKIIEDKTTFLHILEKKSYYYPQVMKNHLEDIIEMM